jgi:hypothetical protein
MRKLLRRAQRASAIFFGNTSGVLDQLQKHLACFVELIALVACRVFGPPRKLNDTRLVTATIRLTMQSPEAASRLNVGSFMRCPLDHAIGGPVDQNCAHQIGR